MDGFIETTAYFMNSGMNLGCRGKMNVLLTHMVGIRDLLVCAIDSHGGIGLRPSEL